jgi:squalene-associated FAD-dependent desaturase
LPASVAIIGGGYAGMAAAVALAEHGLAVSVFEAAQQLGGRARRVDWNGVALDNGLHILIGAYRETLRLVALVNPDADNALRRLPLDWHIHRRFRLRAAPLPAPWHLALGLLAAHGAGFGERMAAAAFMRALRSSGFRLGQDTTVSELLRRHRQGAEITRHLWHPLCIAALNTPPDIASAQVFLNVLRDSLNTTRANSEILLARSDLSALFPAPAADFVRARKGQVLTAHAVDAITAHDGGFIVQARGQSSHFTHVVCALSPHRLATVSSRLPELDAATAMVEQFRYQPIYTVYLQYPRETALPDVMLGMTGGLVQWVFDRGALCGQAGLVAAVISAEGPHQDMTQDELAQRVHAELQQQFGMRPDPVWQRVIAEKRATFACVAGLRRPAQRTPLKNFYLAGDYTGNEYPATLEAAVRSGVACAHHILGSL